MNKMNFFLLLSMVLLTLLPSTSVTVTGTAPKATRGFPSVVMYINQQSVDRMRVPPFPALLDQVNKTFSPAVLVVETSQTVTFQNSDSLLHNIHLYNLETNRTILNIAQPIKSFQTNYTFFYSGEYVVLCDVHPEMGAYIVVTNTSYATMADNDGNYVLELPLGSYVLVIWNIEESKRSSKQVSVSLQS